MTEEDETPIDSEAVEQRRQDYLRGRRDVVKDLHASGGMHGKVAANELLLLLPPTFVHAYERLFWRALSTGSGGGAGGKEGIDKARGNTGTVLGSETRLQASGTGKKYKNTGFLVASEKALARKNWVDQKLMDLVKDIEASMRGESLRTRQCVGQSCKRMLDRKWEFCPSCGTPTRGKG